MSQLQVHLYRDSFTTPWGIRLQGGKDVGQQLVIQRVFANSPAEGSLHRGDIILKLNNCEAAELSHKRAQELFNSAGGQILLLIKRVQYTAKEPPKPKENKAYRTVPLELTGPGGIGSPKLGGSTIDIGTSYLKQPVGLPAEPAMHRQSSKPWEDQEMLYKVKDTLSQIQFPYAAPAMPAPAAAPGTPSGISCINMYTGALPASVAPQPYIPGPPAAPESNYIDPFPNSQPASVGAAEDEEDYEFVPVRQRRSQFNKADYTPQETKPIKPKRAPPVFAPSPVPAPVNKPVTPVPAVRPVAPVYAPAPAPFMPAEGEVVKPATPAWAGTLSSVGGPKLWDGAPKPVSKPARSVSPQKKAAAPAASDGFKPTQTKMLDFSNDPDDGPRVMHLQYNSPLDMYSKANVEETLQGQTQAALGGGNTVATKTPAEERDWTQSALLRMIYEEETRNVPNTAPLPPIEGAPRPAPSPPKKVATSPVPTPPPAVPAYVPKSIPVDVPAGYSDF